MLSLIIDSATKKLYIGLVKDDNILYEKYYEGSNNHAEHIVSGIKLALDSCGYDIKSLNKIICGIGPGSYTGVRMGVTVAKMFACFGNIPLYSISTLALMASDAKGRALAYIDARHGNAFGGIYENGKLIAKEEFKELTSFEGYDITVAEDFKVNPLVVIENATLVENPYLLVPNYLRDTEAERNLCK